MDWIDISYRFFWSFVFGFSSSSIVFDGPGWRQMLAGGLASAMSVLKNVSAQRLGRRFDGEPYQESKES